MMTHQDFFEFQTNVEGTAISYANQADGTTIVTCQDGARILVELDGSSRLLDPKFGRIDYNGMVLYLTDDPYLDTVNVRVCDTVEVIEGTVYRAHACDMQDHSYAVFWTKLKDTPDGPEVVDWDDYTVVAQ